MVRSGEPKIELKTLEEVVDSAGELAVLPQVVAKVLELSNDVSSTASDYEKAIGVDPGFTGRLLKLANSAYYGLPRTIGSIREAVVYLGSKTVRSLALAVTGFNLFVGRADRSSLLQRGLWKHAVHTAILARTASENDAITGVGSDEAFSAGLLHDIGKSIMLRSLGKGYAKILGVAAEKGVPVVEIELQAVGYSHSDIGGELASRWRLPSELAASLKYHHNPEGAQEWSRLAAVVSLANSLAHEAEKESGDCDGSPAEPALLNPEAVTILALGQDQLASFFKEILAAVGDTSPFESLAA